jgi:hypothetical protein
MLKTAQLRFNGLTYGLRNYGDGWDVIFNDEIIEEGISSAQEARKFCKSHSENSDYDHLRHNYTAYCSFTGKTPTEIEKAFNRNCGPKD